MIDPKLREKLKGLETFMNGKILGQAVVREMVPILINGELGINSQGKPKANFRLLGPPGVGKTEVCNAFTDYLLGGYKLVRFDMSEYQTLESIYRLLGHNEMCSMARWLKKSEFPAALPAR
jgi:ATP-dependent Clp protease ATP-binding subunit ClpA